MTVTDDVNDFLNSGGAPSVKFDTVGRTVRGVVVDASVQQQRDIATGEPLFWPDGNPRRHLVITLQTEERDESITDDDGRRRLYAKSHMLNAIREALKKAAAGLVPGGRLAVQYTGDGEPSKPGFNRPKLYKAQYEAPTSSAVGVDDLL